MFHNLFPFTTQLKLYFLIIAQLSIFRNSESRRYKEEIEDNIKTDDVLDETPVMSAFAFKIGYAITERMWTSHDNQNRGT